MIRKMVPRAGVALTTALILSACGGGGGGSATSSNPGESTQTALDYSYPLNQQTEVPTPAPVVLDFSNSINGTDVESSVTLHQGDDASGATVAVTAKTANDGKSLILTPDDKLAPHADYAVVIAGSSTVKDRTIGFSTRALQEGPKSEVVSADTMKLMGMFPDGSSNEPMMDFSTLRLRFSQPLDRSTVSYGNGQTDTVALLDKNDQVVPAHMIVDGPYLTIDPSQNLTPGEKYTIHFQSNQVKSTYGQAFYYVDNSTYQLTPKSSLAEGQNESQRPMPLVQKITQNGNSPLTGNQINQIPVSATLLGDNNNIQQSGDVLGDLAFLPRYPLISPLSIRRGTLLKGASIAVNIGGKVYAGFDTGEVDVRFLSDASGYLIPNPYNSSPDAPRLVKLFMDVAISAEDPTANAGVTQNITQLELIGTALTDTKAGVININAVGVVTPEILGLERGYGTLSFQLQTYKDQTKAPTVAADTTPPTLQSWTMDDGSGTTSNTDDKTQLFKPGDPIVLNFSEPLDPDSVKGKVTLYHNGTPMDIDYHVDGAALVIKTSETTTVDGDSIVKKMVDYVNDSPGNAPNNYHLQVASGVADLAGNPTTRVIDQDLNTPAVVTSKTMVTPPLGSDAIFETVYKHSPIVLSVYPGFPCTLSTDNRDLANGLEGRCAGGFPAITDGTTFDNRPADDSIPVMDMPANRSIIIQFSSDMDPNSIVLGKTFFVQTVDLSGNATGTVDGTLNAKPQEIIFTPKKPWENGQLYQYTLASSGYSVEQETAPSYDPSQDINYSKIVASSDYQCGTNAICGMNNLPLQTQAIGSTTVGDLGDTGNESDKAFYITGPDFDAGGPNIVQYFKGAAPNNNVVQVLRTAPESDTNHNLYHESENPYPAGPQLHKGRYSYTVQEASATDTLGDGSYPDDDPDGVAVPKNAAKILSRGDTHDTVGQDATSGGGIVGVGIGCNFQSSGISVLVTNAQSECPKEKFTYLSSAIVAEVTDQVTNKGIKVLLWPSMVVGTSVSVFGLAHVGPYYSGVPGDTGPQFLRMRFASSGETIDSLNVRNQPIVGWISEKNGQPVLNADVDLYLDVPYTTQYGVGDTSNSANMKSYPVTMQLTGAINFLDDGRMMIQQENTNLVNIGLQLHTGLSSTTSAAAADEGKLAGYGDLFIPPYGSRLNFLSQSIK